MAVTTNTGGIIFADSTYQTTAHKTGTGNATIGGNSTTLTSSSPLIINVIETPSEQTSVLNLPSGTTLANGRSFIISNSGKFPLRVLDGAGFPIDVIDPNTTRTVYCLDNQSTAGRWTSDKGPLRYGIGRKQTSSITLTNNGNQNYTTYNPVAVAISSTKFLLLYPTTSTSQWKAVVCTFSDVDTISYGTPVDCPSGYSCGHHNGDRYSAGETLLSFSENNCVWAATHVASGQKYLIPISVSGTTPSFPSGSLYVGTGGSFGQLKATGSTTFLATFYNDDNYWYCVGYKSASNNTITAGSSYVQIPYNYRPIAIMYLNPQTSGLSGNYAVYSKYIANGLTYTVLQTFLLTDPTGTNGNYTDISNITSTINGTSSDWSSGGYATAIFINDATNDYPNILAMPDSDQSGVSLISDVQGTYQTRHTFTGRSLSQRIHQRISNIPNFKTNEIYCAGKLNSGSTYFVVGNPRNNRFYSLESDYSGFGEFIDFGPAPYGFNIAENAPASTNNVHAQARFNGSVTMYLNAGVLGIWWVCIGSTMTDGVLYLATTVLRRYW